MKIKSINPEFNGNSIEFTEFIESAEFNGSSLADVEFGQRSLDFPKEFDYRVQTSTQRVYARIGCLF